MHGLQQFEQLCERDAAHAENFCRHVLWHMREVERSHMLSVQRVSYKIFMKEFFFLVRTVIDENNLPND